MISTLAAHLAHIGRVCMGLAAKKGSGSPVEEIGGEAFASFGGS